METKDAYKAKFEARLEQAQARLLLLKAAAKEKTADGTIAVSKRIDTLERSISEAKANLAELAHASEDKWVGFKAGLEGAWAAMADSLTLDTGSQTKSDDPKK
ncbi:MAG: hypothetical protein IT521_05720 [Burkholderiales bacterium]|nr:hypothetical protein [Burkholderiales bacterium]